MCKKLIGSLIIIALSIFQSINAKGQNTLFFTTINSISFHKKPIIQSPVLDFSQGINILKVKYNAHNNKNVNDKINIYLQADRASSPELFISYVYQTDDTVQCFYIPQSIGKASVCICQQDNTTTLLKEIQILCFKNGMAYAENQEIIIDSANNLQPNFYKISITPQQTLNYPELNKTEIGNVAAVPVVCPANSILENEPDCYTGYKDSTNRGCNSDLTMPEAFSQLFNCKGTVCGKAGTYLDGIQSRDVDWYLLPGVGTVTVSLKVVADFRVKIYVISMISGCTVFQQSSAASAYAGDTATINYTTSSGTTAIAFWVGTYYDYGVTCGSNYVLKYSLLNSAITPASPVPVANPSCTPTQLLPMSAVAGYTFYWQGNSCNHSVLNAASNPYTVNTSGMYYVNAIYNQIGCWTNCSSVNVSISTNVIPQANHDSICSGETVTLTATGASSYSWNPGNLQGSQIVVDPTTSTIYTVTGTTASCTLTNTLSIVVSPVPVITVTPNPAIICKNDSLILTAQSNLPSVNYLWNPGGITTNTLNVKPSATTSYSVTGISAQGCSSSASQTVTVNPLPEIIVTALPQVICRGNQTKLKAHVTSGTASFTWYPGGLTGDSVLVSPNNTTVFTVIASTPTCSNSSSITITVNPLPELTLAPTTLSICPGDSAIINVNSSIPVTSYLWTPGNFSGNQIHTKPMITTTYSVSGTSPQGCVSSQNITVTVVTMPSITTSATPQSICKGDQTKIKANVSSGTATYTWVPGNLSGDSIWVSPLNTTIYTVTAFTLNCSLSSTIPIIVNPLPEISLTPSASSICPGDSVVLHATSNISNTGFLWTPGNYTNSQITVKPMVTSQYIVTGTSAEGCSASQSITVAVIIVPPLQAAAFPQIICHGEQTKIKAHITSGIANYLWYPGGLSGDSVWVAPSTTTTYTVFANTGTCNATSTIEIIVNPLPVLTINTTAYTICPGDSSMLMANSDIPVLFTWLPGNFHNNVLHVSPNATSTYTLTGTVNATGCSSDTSVTINVSSVPVIDVSASPDSVCLGNSSILIAHATSGTATFNWMPGGFSGDSIIVSPGNSTIYTVTATSAYCSGSASVNVTVNPIPNVFITNSHASICPGDSSLLYASSNIIPADFIWQPGNFSGNSMYVSPSISNTYTLTGIVHNTGCSSTESTIVNVKPMSAVTITATPAAFCSGNSSVLKAHCATDSVSFLWTPNNLTGDSVVITPIASSTISVTGTHTNGCSSSASVNLVVYPLPGAASAISGLTEVCANTNGISYLVPAIQDALLYHWNYSGTGGSIAQNGNSITMDFNAVATSGNLTVYGENNCGNGSASPPLFIAAKPLPQVSASANPTTICLGENTILTSQGTATSYLWNPGNLSGSPVTVSPGQTTTYTLTGNLNGCNDSTTIPVTVELCTGIADNNSTYDFSISIDNNILSIVNEKNPLFSIKIFSVNGQVVYSSKSKENILGTVDISTFAPSVYFLQVQGEAVSKTYKIFIE
jgi:hypothetical protein